MATNQYNNGSNSTQGANTITHFYDRAGLKAANAINVYGQWADRKSMPTKYGKTFKISKWLHTLDEDVIDSSGNFISTKNGYGTSRDYSDVTSSFPGLSEGAGAVNKQTISKITMETSFARYGEMIDYTDEVEMFSEDSVQVRYREELGYMANTRQEDLIQKDMLSTTNVMYGGIATSIKTLDKDSSISYDLIRLAARRLVRNRAIKNTSTVTGSKNIDTRTINKAFYAICGPEVKFDLETVQDSTNEIAWVPAYKYAAAGTLAEGEVGAMHDTRIIESESAMVYRGQGAAIADQTANNPAGLSYTTYNSDQDAVAARGAGAKAGDYFDAFPILFPTQGAFATVGLKGHGKVKFNAVSPMNKELGNPYQNQGLFSYNFWYAGIILQPERLLKILVTASA